LINIEKMLSC